MKKEVYINAHSFDEALDFARDDYFWDIIEVGGVHGWPVIIYWGGNKEYCLDSDCARTDSEFIEEGSAEIDLEDIIPKWNDLSENIKDLIIELIDFNGSLLKEKEECEKMKSEIKAIINNLKRRSK